MRVVLDKVGKTRSMFQMTPPVRTEPAPLPDLEQIFTYTRVPDTLRRPGLKFFKRFQTVDSCSGECVSGEPGVTSPPGSPERARAAALAAQGSTLSSNCTMPGRGDSKASGPEVAEPEVKDASGEHSATSNNAKRFPTIYLHYYPETGWAWVVAACALLARLLLTGLHAATGLLLYHLQRTQFPDVQEPELGEYRTSTARTAVP